MNEIKILLERLAQIQKAIGEAMQILQRISSSENLGWQENINYDPDKYLHQWVRENSNNTLDRERRSEDE